MKKFWLCIYMFAGCGMLAACGGGGQKSADTKTATPEKIEWRQVRITDLPEPATVSFGSGEKYDYIQWSQGNYAQAVRINLKQPRLHLLANPFTFTPVATATFQSKFSFVSKYLRERYYKAVERCRYSKAWRGLAAIDIRERGPLLLRIAKLQPDDGWEFAVAVQSSGHIAGVTLFYSTRSDDDQYLSPTSDFIDGVKSEATMLPKYFESTCGWAYDAIVYGTGPRPRGGFDRFLPAIEKEASQKTDWDAEFSKVDLSRLDDQPVLIGSVETDAKHVAMRSDAQMDNLIQAARSGKGVGL